MGREKQEGRQIRRRANSGAAATRDRKKVKYDRLEGTNFDICNAPRPANNSSFAVTGERLQNYERADYPTDFSFPFKDEQKDVVLCKWR